MDELKPAITEPRPGAAEELFWAFFERGFEACILGKPDGSVVAANPRACALFGYAAEELIAGGRAAVTHGDDPRLAQLVAERDRTGYVRGQLSMCRKDGSRFEAELSSSIFTVASGERYATIIVRDLTERLLAERRIAASEERLRFATDAARMGYWDTDLVSGEGFRSPSLFALFGFAAPIAHWSTEKFLALLHPDDRDRTGDAYRESTTRGAPYDVEFRVVWPDGSVHWMWAQGRVHLDDSGKPRRALGVQIDITRRKEAELAVRRLNEELEERVLTRTGELTLANQELEAFSYRVAHDLRAPLRSISGFIGLLKEDRAGEWSGETADYFDRISSSAAQMGQLIDDMLRLAQVSRQALRITVVDLSAMAAAAIAKLRAAEPGRCVEFVSAAGLMVRADAALVAILIDNLFANAWKFTRKRDRARIEFDRDERGWFCVRDNGVGFDPAQAERIFSGFTRLHSSGEYEGSGIGLATVRRICERHGGDITCDAAVDRGATFRFALGRH